MKIRKFLKTLFCTKPQICKDIVNNTYDIDLHEYEKFDYDPKKCTFTLNKKEAYLAQQFMQQHLHLERSHGAIGGIFSYVFTPTSVGTGIGLRCNICGTVRNITDYDAW